MNSSYIHRTFILLLLLFAVGCDRVKEIEVDKVIESAETAVQEFDIREIVPESAEEVVDEVSDFVSRSLETDLSDDLLLTLDKVEVVDDIGDLIGSSEVVVEMLVIRENGDSRRVLAPGIQTYSIENNKQIILDGFSLQVNNVNESERLLLYIAIFDQDELSFGSNQAASAGLDGAMTVLEQGLQTGKLGTELVAKSSLVTFIVGTLAGAALDWWQQADVIGDFGILLHPSDNWLAGKQYDVTTDNRATEIQFSINFANETTILASDSMLPDLTEENMPEILEDIFGAYNTSILPVYKIVPQSIGKPLLALFYSENNQHIFRVVKNIDDQWQTVWLYEDDDPEIYGWPIGLSSNHISITDNNDIVFSGEMPSRGDYWGAAFYDSGSNQGWVVKEVYEEDQIGSISVDMPLGLPTDLEILYENGLCVIQANNSLILRRGRCNLKLR